MVHSPDEVFDATTCCCANISDTLSARIALSRYCQSQFDASFSLGHSHIIEMAGLLNDAEVMHAPDMPLNGHGLEVAFHMDSFVNLFA